jgi:CBS domain-containing protein
MFMVGGALGALCSHIFPTVGPGFWALVALAGVLGGVMRSPFTGVIFSLELTHRFDAVLPLIIGASAAFAISVLILKRSVLTEKISRHGYHLTREYDVDPLEAMFIGDVMQDDPLMFDATAPARDCLASIATTDPATVADRRQMLYPVVLSGGQLVGVVTRTQLETAAHNDALGCAVATLAHLEPVVAHPDETLRTVAARMARHAVDRMPVVDRHDNERVIGLVSLTMLLDARVRDLHEAVHSERVLRFRLLPRRAAVDAVDAVDAVEA